MLEIPLQPFSTPDYVLWDNNSKYSNGGEFLENTKFPISTVSAEKLSEMCDEFRAKIFEKSGKKDPKLARNPR